MEKVIKNCRGVKRSNDGVNRTEIRNQRENFRSLLGFKENEIKESSVLKSIMNTFEEENVEALYSVLTYKIDLYFHEYRLAVEVDEKGHKDRNSDHETKRKEEIKNERNCKFIRINPDKENFNISRAKKKIFRHIKKLTEESTKNKMINDS